MPSYAPPKPRPPKSPVVRQQQHAAMRKDAARLRFAQARACAAAMRNMLDDSSFEQHLIDPAAFRAALDALASTRHTQLSESLNKNFQAAQRSLLHAFGLVSKSG